MRGVSRVALSILMLSACDQRSEAPRATPPPAEQAARPERFEPQVIRAAPGVHVAVGYGLANSILLEGDDGVVVVDTMGSLEEGRRVRAAFRALTSKPVRAIVYTHNHADHVLGAEAFVDDDLTPDVYAHESTAAAVDRLATQLRPVIARRSFRMFGVYLDDVQNVGIGPKLEIDENSTASLLRPTRTFSDRLTVEVVGLRLELVHAPGETSDQLFVWLPERRVLLPGDNFYEAFPNLYTIRGTVYRSLRDWADSLERMRDLRPEVLVPSHTRPLQGAERIEAALTDYRDAIRFVHDQTIRGMNQGLTPDELVEIVKLPPHLADSPFLREVHGKVSWSVRSVFNGNLGWFDGSPTHLEPLPPSERARRMAELAGGTEALRQAVLAAARDGDPQWVLELSDHALRLDPDDEQVVAARVAALRALGEAASNPNARHYYLTSALERGEGLRIEPPRRVTPRLLAGIPMELFLEGLALNLDPRRAARVERKVGFTFPDTGEEFTLSLRRGVAEVRPRLLPDLDLHAEVDSILWKEALAEVRSAAMTIVRDVSMRKGTKVSFLSFMRLFRPSR